MSYTQEERGVHLMWTPLLFFHFKDQNLILPVPTDLVLPRDFYVQLEKTW